jgi:hypothetical protein
MNNYRFSTRTAEGQAHNQSDDDGVLEVHLPVAAESSRPGIRIDVMDD